MSATCPPAHCAHLSPTQPPTQAWRPTPSCSKRSSPARRTATPVSSLRFGYLGVRGLSRFRRGRRPPVAPRLPADCTAPVPLHSSFYPATPHPHTLLHALRCSWHPALPPALPARRQLRGSCRRRSPGASTPLPRPPAALPVFLHCSQHSWAPNSCRNPPPARSSYGLLRRRRRGCVAGSGADFAAFSTSGRLFRAACIPQVAARPNNDAHPLPCALQSSTTALKGSTEAAQF